jgi:ketosteroid isomerase-like protein
MPKDEMLRTLLLILYAAVALAQQPELEKAMRDAEAAWNRGDLEAFVGWYEDSPETTFLGRDLTRGGVKVIFDRYRRGFPTREAMGVLTYSELQSRAIGDGVALMTGRFALKRAASAGGDTSGRFTLVWKRTPSGWKIVHDHTSS